MESADLARPVIHVKDLLTDEVVYEIYSYGDSVVVMPTAKIAELEESKRETSGVAKFAKFALQDYLKREFKTTIGVEIEGMNRILVYVPERLRPRFIGK